MRHRLFKIGQTMASTHLLGKKTSVAIFFIIANIGMTSSLHAAGIYKSKDADGNTIFTDKPSTNAVAVDVKPVQTYQTPPLKSKDENDEKTDPLKKETDSLQTDQNVERSPKVEADKDGKEAESTEVQAEKPQPLPEYELSVVQPVEGDVFGIEVTTIHAGVKLNRPLNEGDLFYVYLDGKQYGEGTNSPNVDIDTTTIARGPHTLKFTIESQSSSPKDSKRKNKRIVVKETPVINFTKLKTSVRR